MMRTLAVLATILLVPLSGRAECSVELSPVTFGTVDTRENSRGTGEVVVRCDAASGFQIAISGAGSGGTRRMDGPSGSRLDYRLFADAARAVPWGDGGSLGAPVAATSDGNNPRRLTIYGEIPAQSGVPAGEYVGSLQVTLAF
jgi:spore coat protein U-like protein